MPEESGCPSSIIWKIALVVLGKASNVVLVKENWRVFTSSCQCHMVVYIYSQWSCDLSPVIPLGKTVFRKRGNKWLFWDCDYQIDHKLWCVKSGFVGRFYVPRTLLSNILSLLLLKTDVRLLSRFVVKPKKKEAEMFSSKSDTSNGFHSTLDYFTFAKGTYAASTYLNSVILQASTCLQLFKSC